MRRLYSLIIAAAACVAAMAITPQEKIATRLNHSASNHCIYPETHLPQLTPAPAGYEAFYIDHYGRHGSRWLSRASAYQRPVDVLRKAHHDGVLTEQGERLLTTLQNVLAASANRAGELSDKGAEQHQRIAERMFNNFPTVFAGDAVIDARSTVVIRCILSMQNATTTLRSLNPSLRITTDASYHDMYYMGYGHGEDTLATKVSARTKLISDSLYAAHVQPERFVKQIFSHPDHIDRPAAQRLMRDVFDIAGSLQGHHAFENLDLFHLFTSDEIFEMWRLKNIEWYLYRANSPASANRMPFVARALAHDMIDKADAAIAAGKRGADLRFGHESVVLPLACLLEIDNINLSTSDLDNLHNEWQSYDIIPKACNIQMVFYRNAAGDILVKALYNEHEAQLPVETDMAPYYHWNDLKAYYKKKLATPIDWDK
ncbi:MAG: histidine acid phosphatase [Bacteroidales bacterium]|nr:histidine acid phosphatase [Candidatus Sodaliphilus limicaballi]